MLTYQGEANVIRLIRQLIASCTSTINTLSKEIASRNPTRCDTVENLTGCANMKPVNASGNHGVNTCDT